MKGSIFFDKRRNRYYVLWYDPAVKRKEGIVGEEGYQIAIETQTKGGRK